MAESDQSWLNIPPADVTGSAKGITIISNNADSGAW